MNPPEVPQAPPVVENPPPVQGVVLPPELVTQISGALAHFTAQKPPENPIQNKPQVAQVPANPLDLLTKEQQEALTQLSLADPAAYSRSLAELTSRHSQMLVQQQAAPYIELSAQSIVESFRRRKMDAEPNAERARKIGAKFDALMAREHIAALPGLDQARRELELDLRWNTARADVLDDEIKNPPKPTPSLMAPPSNQAPPQVEAGSKIKGDPSFAAMAAQHKFTPEQIAEIERYL